MIVSDVEGTKMVNVKGTKMVALTHFFLYLVKSWSLLRKNLLGGGPSVVWFALGRQLGVSSPSFYNTQETAPKPSQLVSKAQCKKLAKSNDRFPSGRFSVTKRPCPIAQTCRLTLGSSVTAGNEVLLLLLLQPEENRRLGER